ncbi:VOC family protein [candidate division KSB1 bacterium]|nr:VOC family protein [candidate division KSB1 bacterium]
MHMSKILSLAPVLLVRNVVAAANYYRDKLGFSYDRFWGEPANFCMIRRDGHTIMLSQISEQHKVTPHWKVVPQMWNVYLWVDDVEAIYQEMVRRGAQIDYGLGMKNYGVKEFGVQDLDGHDIGFGQIMRPT